MCGGANHGVGESEARLNTRAMGATGWQPQDGLPAIRKRRRFVPQQGDLFDALEADPAESDV